MKERPATNRRQLLRALHRNGGNLAATARDLGRPYSTIHNQVKAHRLRERVAAFRLQQSEKERATIRRRLIKHSGNVSHGADALGISHAVLFKKIGRLDLWEFVSTTRSSAESQKESKESIRAAIRRHRGLLRAVCAELDISANTLRSRMRKYELTAEADALRAAANISGPRTKVAVRHDRREHRAQLLAIIEACGWNLIQAQQKAGISNGTLYSRMRELAIHRPAKLKPEHRLQRLIDGLRVSHGNIERAAFRLKIPAATVRDWCREFDISPGEYRK